MRWLMVLAPLWLWACGDWQQAPEGFTEADLKLISAMALPAEAPPDPTNRFATNPDAAILGQQLFFDPQLSNPPGVACADCHHPQHWFIDARPNANVSQGVQTGSTPTFTKRNSPSLVNVATYRWWGWDGRADSLWMQCAIAYEVKPTMAGTRLTLAKALAQRYALLTWALVGFLPPDSLGGRFSDMELTPLERQQVEYFASVAYKSMAAYLSGLISTGSPFDAFAAGDFTALSPDARAGLKLFIGKAGCVECHSGPALNGTATATTDEQFFKSVGIAQRGPNVAAVDDGRTDGLKVLGGMQFGVFNSAGPYNDAPQLNRVAHLTHSQADLGRFRTKSLRQTAMTGPYLHAGQLATLQEVVHFYNVGGDPSGFSGVKERVLLPLGLTEQEEQQVVAFLQSLTGQPVPAALACDNRPLSPSSNYPLCPVTR